MELLPPGLIFPQQILESKPKTVSRFKLETRVSLKNTNPDQFVLVPKEILGKITKGINMIGCLILTLLGSCLLSND